MIVRIARYEIGGSSHVGIVVSGDSAVSLSEIEVRLGRAPVRDGRRPPHDGLVEWLWRHEGRPFSEVEAEVLALVDGNEMTPTPLSDTRLLAPIHAPQKVIGTGNYAEHFEEIKRCTRFPVISNLVGSTSTRVKSYLASPGSIAGPYDDLPYPASTAELDYEVELAVVMRSRLKNGTEQEARDAILGVTVANDISARDIQMDEMAAGLINHGKNLDATLPLGPWIESDWEPCLDGQMLTRVNGATRQDYPVGKTNRPVAAVISALSADMTLEPGDVILGGTCPGPASFQTNWEELVLHPGDLLETEITTIGILCNRIV